MPEKNRDERAIVPLRANAVVICSMNTDPDLFRRLCDPAFLMKACKYVTRKRLKRTFRDAKNIEDFLGNDQGLGRVLHTAALLRNEQYRPGPVREVRIPKPGRPGKFRSLGVPTLTDRIVSRGIANLITGHLEPLFDDASHGYRPHGHVTERLKVGDR